MSAGVGEVLEAGRGTAVVNAGAPSARTRLTAAEAGGFPAWSTSSRPRASRCGRSKAAAYAGYAERTATGVVPEAAANPTAVQAVADRHETPFSTVELTPVGLGST